jgi:hypothetical protein
MCNQAAQGAPIQKLRIGFFFRSAGAKKLPESGAIYVDKRQNPPVCDGRGCEALHGGLNHCDRPRFATPLEVHHHQSGGGDFVWFIQPLHAEAAEFHQRLRFALHCLKNVTGNSGPSAQIYKYLVAPLDYPLLECGKDSNSEQADRCQQTRVHGANPSLFYTIPQQRTHGSTLRHIIPSTRTI